MKSTIHIGTSGWHYKHWRGTFYPADIKEQDQFSLYQHSFDTVELNNSFYQLPAIKTFRAWKDAAPEKFLFAVKGSRYITHMKKLHVDAATIKKFFSHAGKLQEKMGPVLFQLPPRWKINPERLESFLTKLPAGNRYTFEFRDHSWYDQQVYDILSAHNCAFCIYELDGHLSPLQVTADFVYIRLHGPGSKYQGSYSEDALQSWAEKCIGWRNEKRNVYVYFDNDQAGYAAFNAKKLLELIQ